MSKLLQLFNRLLFLLRRKQLESELEEEMRFHLDMKVQENIEAGLSPEDARHVALRTFGNITLAKEESRMMWGFRSWEILWQDLRFGARMLLKKPGFTLAAVITLALGIGANTAIFSIVNSVLLRPLPYEDPDQIVIVWMDNRKLKIDQDIHSYANYADYRAQNQVFSEMTAISQRSFNLTGEGEPERVMGAAATSSFFSVMRVTPVVGRAFTADEDQSGRGQVAILSYGLWQRRFGSDPQIVGKPISLNGVSRTVIGVMPAGFSFPGKETHVWIPLAPDPQLISNRSSFWLTVVGRLKPGVTVEQARTEMSTIAKRLESQYPDINASYGVNLVPLHEQVVGTIRPALLLLLGAVGLVLLIACANVANLLLVRAAAREREIAIRAAHGASRIRIIRQLFTESMLLAILGGGLGVFVALWGLGVLKSFSPSDIPRLEQIAIDKRVLVFTLAVSCLTALVFGLVPALQASKPNMNEILKEGGRSGSAGVRAARARHLLVISEIAMALVLLIGAGLLIKSFSRLQEFNWGFNQDHLLTARLQLPRSKYADEKQVRNFYEQLLQRLNNMPGVQSAGAVSSIFLSKTPNSTNFSIEGQPNKTGAESIEVPYDSISPNYFEVMGTPIVKGRPFNDRDVEGSPLVAIINETFAREFLRGEDPLGKRFKYDSLDGPAPWFTIVGVVADTRRTGFDSEVRAETYIPHAQDPSAGMTLVLRTKTDPAGLTAALRNEVLSVDKDQPVYDVRTMDQLLVEKIAQRRFSALLLGLFALLALLLAAVGIYGVMAYSVAQRTHEIGIRMALGAQKRDLLRMIVRQGMILTAVGISLGLVVAFALTRVMSGLLYEVSATDIQTFIIIPLILAGVALLANYIPARQAAKVDPMVALRYE